MDIGLLSALAAVLVVALIYIRRKGKVEDSRPEPLKNPGDSTGKFHAVSLKFESGACSAAKEMAGRRFLSNAAPTVPLPGCTSMECRCRFRHHDDRRTGKDRRSPFSPAGFSAATGKFEREQRHGQDRRQNTDPDDVF